MVKDQEALSQQLQQLSTDSRPKLTDTQRLLLVLAGKSPAPQKIYCRKHPRDSKNPEFLKHLQRDLDAATKLKAELLQMISRGKETTETKELKEVANG